jgi:hypothetical protein
MRRLLTFVGVFTVLAGCGDDGFNPSVPGSTPLNQLSAEQASQLCVESVNYDRASTTAAKTFEQQCRAIGILAVVAADGTDALAPAVCADAYNKCKQGLPPVPPSVATVCKDAAADLAPCTATVDQFATCVEEQVGFVVPSCNGITNAKAQALLEQPAGPTCEQVQASCGLTSAALRMTSALKSAR